MKQLWSRIQSLTENEKEVGGRESENVCFVEAIALLYLAAAAAVVVMR